MEAEGETGGEREREREYGGWEMEERRDYIIKNSVNHGNVILVKKCAEYVTLYIWAWTYMYMYIHSMYRMM